MKKRSFECFLAILMILFCANLVYANGVLSQREGNIVYLASYTAKGEQYNLDKALNKALDEKMSVYEVKEVLIQMYPYCGFPKTLNALTTCMKVMDERSAKGIYDSFGKEPEELPDNSNKFEIGAAIQSELVGAPVTGRIYEFEPTIDKYLKEHLFADIFSRGVLSYEEREIATIAALASLNGVEPQLRAHIQIALNIGISQEKIDEILKLTKYNLFRNEIFARGEKNSEYSQYFKGQSYIKTLSNDGLQIANVTFEPSCRNNWHIHHKCGQILLVTQGRGYYQEWGQPARELKAGDVVNISPETKHWHGASKDSWFVHVVIEVPAKNGYTEWLEPVTDEEYAKLK